MRAGKSRQLGLGGGCVPLSTRLWENKGGPRPPDPRPQEPRPRMGRGQGSLGPAGIGSWWGTVHHPPGRAGRGPGCPPGTTWDMLRWSRHTAPSQVAQLMGWGRHTGPRTREEAGGTQATGSRDPGEARGRDLKPSVRGGWSGQGEPRDRLCRANGPEVGGEAGVPRAWAGQDCAGRLRPSQPLAPWPGPCAAFPPQPRSSQHGLPADPPVQADEGS